MVNLSTLRFLVRHSVELQGLRTMVVGMVLCVLGGSSLIALTTGHSGPHWLIASAFLLAWQCDVQLSRRYQKTLGYVSPQRSVWRLAGLCLIVSVYVALRVVEQHLTLGLAVSALYCASVLFHIGFVSGQPYRGHYLVGAVCWVPLVAMPAIVPSLDVQNAIWTTAFGLTLSILGYRDHVLLVRLLPVSESADDEEL